MNAQNHKRKGQKVALRGTAAKNNGLKRHEISADELLNDWENEIFPMSIR